MNKIKKIFNLKKSVIFSWLLYYALILTVPVLISVVTYVKTAEVVENEINNSNMLLLKRVQQQMDLILSDAQRLSLEISLNTSVNYLLNMKGDIKDSVSPYDVYKVVKDLGTYKIPNSSIDDFYVYFKKLDLVVSPDSGNNSRSFYDVYFAGKDLTYEKWLDTLSDNYKGDFIIINNSYAQESEGKTIIYIKTIPFLNQGNASANVIMSLDASRFMEDARDIESLNKGTLLILNKDSDIVISSKPKSGINIRYGELSEDKGMLREKTDTGKAVVSYITSKMTDWKYVNVMPDAVFWQKYKYLRNLTFTGILICFITGAIIAYLSLRKNYNPINNLINMLEKRNGLSFDKKNNEFLFIQEAIDRVYSEKEKVDNILIQQNKVLKSNFIARLLKGKTYGKVPVEDLLILHDINFKSQYFAVMVFYIEDFNIKPHLRSMVSEDLDIIENYKMVQSTIKDVIEEILGQKNYGIVIELDEMMVCLVNFRQNDIDGMKREMSKVVLESRKLLREVYEINIKISLSNIHETVAGIPEAYDEALEAMEYKKLLEIEEIIHFDDIKEFQKGNYYYYPLEMEQQLINSIKVGDFEKSKTILNEIFKNNFEKPVMSIKISRCLMFDLVSTMIKMMNELNYDKDDRFLEELNPIDRLLNCESINEMKGEMINILNMFCDFIKERNRKKNSKRSISGIRNAGYQLKENIILYVQENYKDFNLGISSIADHFGIHPIQLSKVFLEQSGESLLDFISKFRINEAKKLFKENCHSNLEEISKEVGFSNIRTFTRSFKKYEGVTPGKYKDAVG